MANEKTLVLIKPDGVSRNLIGKIILKFEEAGLKPIAMKMMEASNDLAKKHYVLDEEWTKSIFNKAKTAHEKEGKPFSYNSHMEFGSMIQKWNISFLCEGPVLAMVLQGQHAIEIVRKLIGSTEPKQAPPGTIRGDFASFESYEIANAQNRVIRNLVHASDSAETAKREISLWFKDSEIHTI